MDNEHSLACSLLSNDVKAMLEKGVCIESQTCQSQLFFFYFKQFELQISDMYAYVHQYVCYYMGLIAQISVCVYHMCGCVNVCASKIGIWGCWLGGEKEHDKCAKLVARCSQTVGGKEACRGWGVLGGPCAATVTCRTWHSSGQVAGGRGKHHPPATMGVGAGRTGWLWSWRFFFPRLYQREK